MNATIPLPISVFKQTTTANLPSAIAGNAFSFHFLHAPANCVTDTSHHNNEGVSNRVLHGSEFDLGWRWAILFVGAIVSARQAPFPARLKADDLGHQLVVEALDKKLFVLDLMLPSLGRRTAIEAECLARLRLGCTAMALEQFRAAHGNRYPATSSELTPNYLSATPADPFDGQPLRYHQKSSGYALYSIGPDLKDDSGERKNGKEADFVFSVTPPLR